MKKKLFFLSLIPCFTLSAQNLSINESNNQIKTNTEKNSQFRPSIVMKISEELIGNLYPSENKETVVLLIAGSEPRDRNGTIIANSENNSLKLLAEGLSSRGYNTFTYDKRTVNLVNDKKDISILDFQNGINDAKMIIMFLKNKLKFKNVIVAGHSEGSLVGMIASESNTAAFISLAGTGNTIDIILKEQFKKQTPMLKNEVDRILKELKKGNKVKDINPLLQSLFAEHNQPLLIEWIKLNPAKEIAKLKIPVLIINGTNDLQVSENEAKILHKANSKSELVIIENMNHIFKNENENINSYSKPDVPINEELIPVITKFLQKNKF